MFPLDVSQENITNFYSTLNKALEQDGAFWIFLSLFTSKYYSCASIASTLVNKNFRTPDSLFDYSIDLYLKRRKSKMTLLKQIEELKKLKEEIKRLRALYASK